MLNFITEYNVPAGSYNLNSVKEAESGEDRSKEGRGEEEDEVLRNV